VLHGMRMTICLDDMFASSKMGGSQFAWQVTDTDSLWDPSIRVHRRGPSLEP
jgi:hypothetical protein